MKNPLILLGILMIFSCTQEKETEVQQDPTSEINANWEKFVDYWHSEDAEGCVSIYHDDIIYLAPESREIDNSADVADFYRMLFSNHQSSVYTHTSNMIDFCGQMAVEHCEFEVDWVTNEGVEWTYKARMVIHWTADTEGNYKVKTLIFNNPEPEEGDEDDQNDDFVEDQD